MKLLLIIFSGILVVFLFFGLILFYEYVRTSDVYVTSIKRATSTNSLHVESKTFSVLFLGDVMLDRFVRDQIALQGPEYPFTRFNDVFPKTDAVVINGECPFAQFESVTANRKSKQLTFTCDPSLLPMLASYGVTHISQANNHTRDFGVKGEIESRMHIEKSGIRVVGDFDNTAEATCLTRDCGIVVSGFNQFSHTTHEESIAFVSKEINKQHALGRFVIVFPHWGNEYEVVASDFQKTVAESFVNAGADLVVGSHPHVVQNMEIIKGAPVWYSLGNAVFDQWFSDDVKKGRGLVFEFQIEKEKYHLVKTSKIDFSIDKGKIVPLVP